MSIKINLTIDATGTGVHFSEYLASHFDGFSPYQFPVFLAGDAPTTTQILHLDTPTTGEEADTRVVLLEGDDFFYTFSNHSVSGTIDQIRLGTLGAAWDDAEQDLALTDDGLIGDMGARVTIANLGIINPVGIKGEVHEIVRGMMGGNHDGTLADADPILEQIWGTAHDLTGSRGNDIWTGTQFDDLAKGGAGRDFLKGANGADSIYGNAGNDKLFGGKGSDLLNGGAGKDNLSGGGGRDVLRGGKGQDVLDGGAGKDVIIGGKGADWFVFKTSDQANGDKIKGFKVGQNDLIDVSAIDADSIIAEDQAFIFLGMAAFTGTAGELRLNDSGRKLKIEGDTDGDGLVDFVITVTGAGSLSETDFIL